MKTPKSDFQKEGQRRNYKKYMLTLLTLILSYSITFACDCPDKSDEELWKNANLVFTGKVIKVKQKSGVYHYGRNIPSTTIEVTRVYKGKDLVHDTVTIFNYTMNTCEFDFSEEEEYIIYGRLYVGGSFIVTHKCSGTKLLSKASDTLIFINSLNSNKSNLSIDKEQQQTVPPPPMPVLRKSNYCKD